MKKKFSFENLLVKKRDFSIEEKEIIFFSMHNIVSNCINPTWINVLSDLHSLMADNEYYIALNVITTKGKKRFFREALVSCSKADLLNFLSDEVDVVSGYSRPFVISPLFSTQPEYVISVTEEACVHFYKIN
ncbi:hypothetical protein [Leminorella grimontii]|uniref:hypothetical protein n=1 Tax=Leminorella grimontii TaxID=82981 RepID=UPI0020814BEB|nr:hypothetical protein [Leminorella grimontii]GKX59581.1 hypothetical protein SOASR031_18960 [Leminorella grimontii]